MKLYPRTQVNVIGFILICLFLRLSYWQWERHNWKLGVIQNLENNLALPPTRLNDLITTELLIDLINYRRVVIEGRYLTGYDILLRNRRLNDIPGMHLISPFELNGTNHDQKKIVLVNRGFIPLTEIANLAQYPPPKGKVSLLGLIKEEQRRDFFLAPADPEPTPDKWILEWLRVDIPKIQKQSPFKLLPFYIELMGSNPAEGKDLQDQIVKSTDGKEDLLMLPLKATLLNREQSSDKSLTYPVPSFSTIIPPGRHLGYVFEWGFMAFMTAIICFVIQLSPSRKQIY